MLPRKFKMPQKALRRGCRTEVRLESNERDAICRETRMPCLRGIWEMPSSSPDALNPATLIGWHVNTQAAPLAHTRSHTCCTSQRQRGRGRGSWWERWKEELQCTGRLRGTEHRQGGRTVKRNQENLFSNCTGGIALSFVYFRYQIPGMTVIIWNRKKIREVCCRGVTELRKGEMNVQKGRGMRMNKKVCWGLCRGRGCSNYRDI